MTSLFTDDDRRLLEHKRLQRFHFVFPEFKKILIHIDMENRLNFHCECVDEVEELLEAPDLGSLAYLILGCTSVAIWFEGDRMWTQAIRAEDLGLTIDEPKELQSVQLSETLEEAEAMTTAILERPAAIAQLPAAPATAPTITTLPGCTIAALAGDVEQSPDAIKAWVLSQNALIIPFAGEEIVSGDVAIAILQNFTPLMIQRRMENRGLLGAVTVAAPKVESNGAALKADAQTTTAIAPASAKKAAVLRMNAKYKDKVVRDTRKTLNTLLPTGNQKADYLEAIVSETEQGQTWLNKIVTVYIEKFKTSPEQTPKTFLTMAKRIFNEMRSASAT